MDLQKFKITFDGHLQNYLDKKINEAKFGINYDVINGFLDYINTFIFSGGKRIRPYCTWVMYKAYGGKDEKTILDFSILFELLHSMALIHDDIIDQSPKRHNVDSMHAYIAKKVDNHHIGVSQAILIGDLIFAWVYEFLDKEYSFSKENFTKAKQQVHSMIQEVILGQMIDVDLMLGKPVSFDVIEKKNLYKTASYTFTRPLLAGAVLAGVDGNEIELIKSFANHLGVAFQIRDDYFDITFKDPTKRIFSDIEEGQQTFFTNYINEKGSQKDKDLLKNCLGKKLDDIQIKQLQEMFTTSGAIEEGKKVIAYHIGEAYLVLEKLSFEDIEQKKWLGDLIKKLSVE